MKKYRTKVAVMVQAKQDPTPTLLLNVAYHNFPNECLNWLGTPAEPAYILKITRSKGVMTTAHAKAAAVDEIRTFTN